MILFLFIYVLIIGKSMSGVYYVMNLFLNLDVTSLIRDQILTLYYFKMYI